MHDCICILNNNPKLGHRTVMHRLKLTQQKNGIQMYLCYVMLCYVMLCILYLKSIHKIVYNKKLINIDWLMLRSLQETKCDTLLLLLLFLLRRRSSNNKKQHSSSMIIAQKRVDCISVIYNTFIYAHIPHTFATVNWEITISY